jgi:hypothetical protein
MAVRYNCPHCGKQGEAADQFAGQTGPCAGCGKPVTIPLAGAAFDTGGYQRKGSSWSLPVVLAVVGVGMLVCCGGIGALLAPAVFSARTAAKRMQASNCTKQIVLALHNYHSIHGTFPPAVVTDAAGKPLSSGRVLLLPFLEQEGVYQQFDKSKAWDSPENLSVSQRQILPFINPAAPRRSSGQCDFVFVTGAGTAFPGAKSTSLADMKDGTSNTLVVIETKSGPPSWAAPVDWDASSGPIPVGSFANVTIAAFADGSVQTLMTNPPHPQSDALCTIAGGEVIP